MHACYASTIRRPLEPPIPLAPSAVKINSVKLTVTADPDPGKLIERRLDVDFSHGEDAINAVECALIEQLRQT